VPWDTRFDSTKEKLRSSTLPDRTSDNSRINGIAQYSNPSLLVATRDEGSQERPSQKYMQAVVGGGVADIIIKSEVHRMMPAYDVNLSRV
jgi:hypothetical protein